MRRRLVGSRDLVWLAITVTICAAFVAVLLRFLSMRHEVYRMGYQLADLTREHSLLLEENRRLTVEVALQSNAERLEREALDRLGLRETVSGQVIEADE